MAKKDNIYRKWKRECERNQELQEIIRAKHKKIQCLYGVVFVVTITALMVVML